MDRQLSAQLDALDHLVTSDASLAEARNQYEDSLGLPGNPFSPSGIADATGSGPPLRQDELDRIISFIRQGYVTGRTQFMVIRGDYGSGKTHTLRFIENVVNTRMSKGDRAARAVYVERPRIEAHELNRTILRSLGDDTVRKYVWFAIHQEMLRDMSTLPPPDDLIRLRESLTASSVRGRGRPSTRQGPRLWVDDDPALMTPFNDVFNPEAAADYRTFFDRLEKNNWDREQVRHYLAHLLIRAIDWDQPTELAQAFVALLLAPNEASFSSWESLLAISNTRTVLPLRAPQFLQVLLRILELNGIVYLYLLLDEFEEVPQGALLTARQRQDYLYTMREVFNSIQNGLSVVIAISPGGWDALAMLATPLADVNSTTVILPPVEIDDAIRLVQFYLGRQRGNSERDAADLNPFNQEMISHIMDNFPNGVQRTPRNLIQLLHRLLEHAADRQVSHLDMAVVDEVLSDFGTAQGIGDRQRRNRRRLSNVDASNG